MVNGQDKLVQGGEGEKGGGGGKRRGLRECMGSSFPPVHPSPELVSSILRTICFFFLTFVAVIVVLF